MYRVKSCVLAISAPLVFKAFTPFYLSSDSSDDLELSDVGMSSAVPCGAVASRQCSAGPTSGQSQTPSHRVERLMM
jgi:hypothetical protein